MIMFFITGKIKVDSTTTNRQLHDSIVDLNAQIEENIQQIYDISCVNIILRNNITNDKKLKEDSVYMELATKYE